MFQKGLPSIFKRKSRINPDQANIFLLSGLYSEKYMDSDGTIHTFTDIDSKKKLFEHLSKLDSSLVWTQGFRDQASTILGKDIGPSSNLEEVNVALIRTVMSTPSDLRPGLMQQLPTSYTGLANAAVNQYLPLYGATKKGLDSAEAEYRRSTVVNVASITRTQTQDVDAGLQIALAENAKNETLDATTAVVQMTDSLNQGDLVQVTEEVQQNLTNTMSQDHSDDVSQVSRVPTVSDPSDLVSDNVSGVEGSQVVSDRDPQESQSELNSSGISNYSQQEPSIEQDTRPELDPNEYGSDYSYFRDNPYLGENGSLHSTDQGLGFATPYYLNQVRNSSNVTNPEVINETKPGFGYSLDAHISGYGAIYHRVPIAIFFDSADKPNWDNELSMAIDKSNVSKDEALSIMTNLVAKEGPEILVSQVKTKGDITELKELLQLHFSLNRNMSRGPRVTKVGIDLKQLLDTYNMSSGVQSQANQGDQGSQNSQDPLQTDPDSVSQQGSEQDPNNSVDSDKMNKPNEVIGGPSVPIAGTGPDSRKNVQVNISDAFKNKMYTLGGGSGTGSQPLFGRIPDLVKAQVSQSVRVYKETGPGLNETKLQQGPLRFANQEYESFRL